MHSNTKHRPRASSILSTRTHNGALEQNNTAACTRRSIGVPAQLRHPSRHRQEMSPAVRRTATQSAHPTAQQLKERSRYTSTRCLSTTQPRRQIVTKGEPHDLSDVVPTPITHMSETETLMADSVSKFAQEVILPRSRDMDEAERMDPTIIEQCFEQGLMGIEIPEQYGGAGMNFTAGIVAIEELARVDPSVSVMVDVHNTLVNTAIIKYGTEESKRKWLPKLATNTVGESCRVLSTTRVVTISPPVTMAKPDVQALSVSPSQSRVRTPSP